jgi:hypothetical protein
MKFLSQYLRLVSVMVAILSVLGFTPAASALTNTQSAQKALNILSADAASWTQSQNCIACHRQGAAVFAIAKAQANGYDMSATAPNGQSNLNNLKSLAQALSNNQQPGGYWIHDGSYVNSKSSYASFRSRWL